MINELIVHMGPPKTSTTAVQFAFHKSSEYLNSQGLQYEPGEGRIAHHDLAKFLKTTPIDELSNLSTLELREHPIFPPLSTSKRQMLSCEDFSSLLVKERAECLVRWATPKQLSLVLAFREPSRWLWSIFQQQARTKSSANFSWEKFIDEATETPEFFLSEILKPWLQVEPAPRIFLLDLINTSVFAAPAHIAEALDVELTEQALMDNRNNLYNESLQLGESMLTPIFNEEVINELKYRQQNNWGDIPEAFVRNVLLYQSSIAKTMFELGRDLENKTREDSSFLLDDSSFVALQRFSDVWWDDFDTTLAQLPGIQPIGLSEASRVRPPIFTGYDLSIGKGFPVDGFANLIELPPEFFSMVRLFAANIGLLYKTMRGSADTNWLLDDEVS
jgi:hypothetical protein